MQEHKQKLYRTCSCCGRDTWHIKFYQFYSLLSILQSLWTESLISTTGLLRTKVAFLWIYILGRVLEGFPCRLLWTIMDAMWAVVIAQPQSVVVGRHFTVTIIKLLNVLSRIPIIHQLHIYFCRNSSWNVGWGGSVSRRAFVVVGIVECLRSGRGGWGLVDSHGAGTVIYPFTTGREVGTETCGMDNVFPTDGLWFGLDAYESLYEYIYLDPWYRTSPVIMSADEGRDGLWWPALPGHWLSYTGCWQSLLVMYWLMFGMLFLFSTTSLVFFLSTDFAFRITDWSSCHGPHFYMLY